MQAHDTLESIYAPIFPGAENLMQSEMIALRRNLVSDPVLKDVVGSSQAMRLVLIQVSKVAPTHSTVLLLGETGTGKELIARAIHQRSNRSARPFIRVNCAAIPQPLIASELFGHEKGAFTGAVQRRLGRFEAAHGGTIFLDEIGELPQETQVALLRVLQEREFERVGGTQTIPVDVRVIAATNRDLHQAVADGAFREDLFYRLNVIPVRLPALRERKGDIHVLVEYFVDHFAKKIGKEMRRISRDTLQVLERYSWPGNIRELQNIVERAVIFSEGETLSIEEAWLAPAMPNSCAGNQDKHRIEIVLRQTKGRISGPRGAAVKLGMPRQTLESKIRRLGLNCHAFKNI